MKQRRHAYKSQSQLFYVCHNKLQRDKCCVADTEYATTSSNNNIGQLQSQLSNLFNNKLGLQRDNNNNSIILLK